LRHFRLLGFRVLFLAGRRHSLKAGLVTGASLRAIRP